MKINPPKKITFYISAALGLVGLIAFFVSSLSPFTFWLVLAGLVLLLLGNTVNGL